MIPVIYVLLSIIIIMILIKLNLYTIYFYRFGRKKFLFIFLFLSQCGEFVKSIHKVIYYLYYHDIILLKEYLLT